MKNVVQSHHKISVTFPMPLADTQHESARFCQRFGLFGKVGRRQSTSQFAIHPSRLENARCDSISLGSRGHYSCVTSGSLKVSNAQKNRRSGLSFLGIWIGLRQSKELGLQADCGNCRWFRVVIPDAIRRDLHDAVLGQSDLLMQGNCFWHWLDPQLFIQQLF